MHVDWKPLKGWVSQGDVWQFFGIGRRPQNLAELLARPFLWLFRGLVTLNLLLLVPVILLFCIKLD